MFENIRAAWTNFSHFKNIKHRNNDTWKGFIQWGTHKFSKGGRQYLNNESWIEEFQKKLVHHHDFFSKKILSDREFDLPQNAEPRVEFKTNTNTNWYHKDVRVRVSAIALNTKIMYLRTFCHRLIAFLFNIYTPARDIRQQYFLNYLH